MIVRIKYLVCMSACAHPVRALGILETSVKCTFVEPLTWCLALPAAAQVSKFTAPMVNLRRISMPTHAPRRVFFAATTLPFCFWSSARISAGEDFTFAFSQRLLSLSRNPSFFASASTSTLAVFAFFAEGPSFLEAALRFLGEFSSSSSSSSSACNSSSSPSLAPVAQA